MNPIASPRRLDLDWVRIAAFGALILYHVGMYYVTWDFHIKSPQASHAIEPLMLLLNPWRLSLLFVVSGCATAFMLHQPLAASPGRIALARSRFLLLPVVFGMLAIVPPQSWVEVMHHGYTGTYPQFWLRYLRGDHSFCHDGKCLRLPTWNHLWFIVYLWAYTMVVLVLARATRGLADGPATSWLRGWRLALLPWVLLALARVLLAPRYPVTHAFWGDLYDHAQYFAVFVVGFAIARDEAAWTWLAARRYVSLGVALASYTIYIAYVANFDAQHPPTDAARVLARSNYAALQWSAILAVLGWARHTLAGVRDTPARRYLTDAVFCYYIVHQTAILLAAHCLGPLQLPPAIEAAVIIAITLATCFASYEIVRRMRWVAPLFGVRRLKGGPVSPSQPSSARASPGTAAASTP